MAEQKEISDVTADIIEKFESTFENGNLVDTFSQIGEFTLDQAIQNDLLKDIPVFGLLVSGYKTVVNIRDFNLTKKVFRFLYHLQDTTPEQRQKFVKKYVETNQENTAASVLDILDKLNSANSVPLVCNLMKAVINDEITIAQFNRLTIAIQKTAFTDLSQLGKYAQDYDEEGLSDALQAAGLIYQSVYDGGSAEEGDNTRFKISSNGYLLLKYGFIKNEIDNHTRSTEINSGITQEKFDKIFNFNN